MQRESCQDVLSPFDLCSTSCEFGVPATQDPHSSDKAQASHTAITRAAAL
jgi:hypothetical protein